MSRTAARVPCIVAGRDITGLGATRCLAGAGIPAFTACDDGLVPCSRYYRPVTTRSGRPWRLEMGDAGCQLLADLPFERAVVIPCADDLTAWLAELPQELKRRFPSCHAPVEALRQLQDKRLFSTLCRHLDVPHPRCFEIERLEDLASLPFGDAERIFFKPSNSIRFLEAFGTKGIWVQTEREARQRWQEIEQAGLTVLGQEYVSGPADQHYFIDGFRDAQGVTRARMARRRLRIFPLDFGNSSYCRQVPVESIQPAWESLERLLDHVQYRGIFSAEFKQDARDGQFKILEINTRVWVYVAFACWCGLNVCEMAYLDAQGLPVPNATPRRPGAGCLDAYRDYESVRGMSQQDRPPLWKLIGQWCCAHKAVFTLRDPWPALRWLAKMLRQKFRSHRGPNGRG